VEWDQAEIDAEFADIDTWTDNVGAALQAMRDGGYRLGDSIVDAALKQAGET
jgi:hypothetical protein